MGCDFEPRSFDVLETVNFACFLRHPSPITENKMANRELDNKAAIMIVIEHLGDVKPGQKCSAVFFDRAKIQREKEFHANLYSQNGVHDPDALHAMVEANVPTDPYWLVSIKPAAGADGQARICRVDHRTRKVLPARS